MPDVQKTLEDATKPVGGRVELARRLGLTRQAVYQWTEIPPKHVLKIEEFTGLSRHQLRPDLYPEPERAA